MTQYPEVYLAKELGIYANIALVTDYDAGLEDVTIYRLLLKRKF